MKKSFYIALLFMVSGTISAQQFPFMEGYNINPFSLSAAYAGIHNSKILFVDYRSDWSGIDGGPTTYQISYNDKITEKVGLGGKFIYDKTDIFKQTLILGTYTYEVKVAEGNRINFGLSAGFFRNSIDLAKYFNDPLYIQDVALLYGQVKSKLKFASDFSVLYRYNKAEGGILFSNLMFGTARYRNTDMKYKPLKNYLIHASYLFAIDSAWSVQPTVILRGGQNIPVQFELASTVFWNDRFWGTAVFKTGGIYGLGIGGEVISGIMLNYSYSLSSNVALNTFGSHQISLGIRIFKFIKSKKV